MKKYMLITFGLLFVFSILLSGCTSKQPTDGDAEADEAEQIANETQEVQDKITDTIDNPNATPQEILDALAAAQGLGLDDEKLTKEAMEKLKAWIMEILNNPNSTTEMLLYALGIAQMLGLDDEKMYNDVINTIKARLEKEMKDPYLCKDRLIEIATLAQKLGFDEIADVALNRAEVASDKCGFSQLTYTYTESSNTGSRVIVAKATGGVLTLYAPGGFTLPDSTSYYFTDGVLDWQYSESINDGCAITTREGTGTEKLESMYDSLFYLENIGKYGGGVSAIVKVKVTVSKIPPQPGEDDPCPETENKTYYEDEGVQFNIEGTTNDLKHLIDSRAVGGKDEDYDWSEKTTWDLKLGN